MKVNERFDTEARLVECLLLHLQNASRRIYRAEVELDAGVGLADIVVYSRRPRSTYELRLLAAIPPRLAPLLDEFTAKGIHTADDLSRVLGILKPAAQRVMNQLQRLDLFEKRANGSLKSISEAPFEKIIALEAKLSDWSRALVQAYRNRHRH